MFFSVASRNVRIIAKRSFGTSTIVQRSSTAFNTSFNRTWRSFSTTPEEMEKMKKVRDAAVEAAGGDEAAADTAQSDSDITLADVTRNADGEIEVTVEEPKVAGEKKVFSPKLEAIATEISTLNLLEVADLVDLLQDKLNLPDISTMNMGGGGGGGGAAAVEEEEVVVEKTEFDVKLEKFEAKSKIKLIKQVRKIADLGLKEAKAMVESAPVVVKKSLTKDEAEQLKKELEELGGEIILE
eukprot:GSMAST32.ASY1.ANO1.1024.1 assembled CDS